MVGQLTLIIHLNNNKNINFTPLYKLQSFYSDSINLLFFLPRNNYLFWRSLNNFSDIAQATKANYISC